MGVLLKGILLHNVADRKNEPLGTVPYAITLFRFVEDL